jgi:hypothetical protein
VRTDDLAEHADIALTDDDLDALIQAVSSAFRSPADANQLLLRIGYPRGDAPNFAYDHRNAWNQVFLELGNGVIPSPYRRVLTRALQKFPQNTAFRRLATTYLTDPGPGSAPGVRHVVVVGASPGDAQRVRGDAELRAIRAALRDRGITVTPLSAAAATDLRELRDLKPDVLHLATHGNGADLYFVDSVDGERTVPVPARQVVDLLATYRHDEMHLKAVVLNSCHSAGVAQLFTAVTETVIGHRGELDDGCAVQFAKELYTALPGARSFAAAATSAAATAAVSDSDGGLYCGDLPANLVVLPAGG